MADELSFEFEPVADHDGATMEVLIEPYPHDHPAVVVGPLDDAGAGVGVLDGGVLDPRRNGADAPAATEASRLSRVEQAREIYSAHLRQGHQKLRRMSGA